MPRIRTVKPEFFTSLTLARVSRDARLTFIGLWTYADDEGRGRDEPRLLKAALWPLDDDVTAAVVDAHMAELETARVVQRYGVEGEQFFAIRNWKEHQKIDRPRLSQIPEPPARRADDPPPARDPSPTSRRSLDEGSSLEGKGKERKGRTARARREDSTTGAPPSVPDGVADAADAPPAVPPPPDASQAPTVIAQAVDLWRTHFGLVSYGRMGKALSPTRAAGIPPERLVAALTVYCEQAPYRDWLRQQEQAQARGHELAGEPVRDTRFCSPEDFVNHLTEWLDLLEPLGDAA